MIKICITCGKEFESRNPRALNCSKECSRVYELKKYHKRYFANHIKKVCPVCGKEFYVVPASGQVCCSRNCTKRLCTESKPIELNGRCHICGKEFTPQYKGQKYCSDYCRDDPKAKLLRRFLTMAVQKMELKGEIKIDCNYSRRQRI